VRLEGDRALSDDRHGSAYKLPPSVRQWLVRVSRHDTGSAELD